ncbi:hypothetical protein niasHT_022420 [Heterodera trifolii]|uniref:Malate dehydrogenase n=1 Tax=Heterodera trifolii TaxID=157864 RepID=A0ABD2KLS8_9BILA
MNVECGQYVQHCLKVRMWDGTIIRDCDPLAFCPPDGSKVFKNADYFCCAGNEFVAPVGEVHAFVVKCMQSVGTSAAHAAQLADLLLDADIVGHYSHGLNRLCIYIEDVASGVKGDGEPKVLKQKGATAWVDGCDLLGAVVGNFCTELATKLAKEHGIGWVVCKRSNHYGICQHYAKKIANAGFLGLSFTNTSPIIFPTRSSQIGLGTNPISCCANSREKGDGFILDMASSTVALGKVEIAKVNGKSAIPSAWGADSAGRPSTDPLAVLDGGGLLPLGGVSEENGSHKGTGIAMMGELFCGLLGGASFGKNVRSWREVQKSANLGQCFVAIDPECFAPAFVDNLQLFLDQTRGLKPRDPSKSVLVPGDPERMNSERSAKAGGVIYSEGQIRDLEKLAKKQNVGMFDYKANL